MMSEQCLSFKQDIKIVDSTSQSSPDAVTERFGDKYCPYDVVNGPKITSGLPPETWTLIQSTPANYSPQHFLDTSRDLLENPNLTVSFVARAELSYQSFTDATFNPNATTPEKLAGIVKHLRTTCRPRLVPGGVEGYSLEWTAVRKLIPRNAKVDEPLMQTCHLFTSHQDIRVRHTNGREEGKRKAERCLIVYIPHVSSPEEVPFYHPKVQSLAILYTHLPDHDSSLSWPPSPGTLSLYYSLFPSYPLDNRLSRTALRLLEIIHKHSRGRQAGYRKRVHHDQIIGQKRFQDTYARLKGKYARELINAWVEQTPAEKHVFEDLAIAAFLIQLWIDMYGSQSAPGKKEQDVPVSEEDAAERKEKHAQQNFPGFVDIGCGNGLLVYLLNAQGWHGWGFDARRRKTWSTFPACYSDKLKELLLVPLILPLARVNDSTIADPPLSPPPPSPLPPSHNGLFKPGTFIISNHADELTPWTPLLARLSASPFLAIPCCSHDFSGTRFRAPTHTPYLVTDPNEKQVKSKLPSAYASLCSWLSHLTATAGYRVEKEFLRIPSTRNMAVLGRYRAPPDALRHPNPPPEDINGNDNNNDNDNDLEKKLEFLRSVVQKEMGGAVTMEQLASKWMDRSRSLVKQIRHGH